MFSHSGQNPQNMAVKDLIFSKSHELEICNFTKNKPFHLYFQRVFSLISIIVTFQNSEDITFNNFFSQIIFRPGIKLHATFWDEISPHLNVNSLNT